MEKMILYEDTFINLAAEFESLGLTFKIQEGAEIGVDAYCYADNGLGDSAIIARFGAHPRSIYSVEEQKPWTATVYNTGFVDEYLAINDELDVNMRYDEVIDIGNKWERRSGNHGFVDSRIEIIDGEECQIIDIYYVTYGVKYIYYPNRDTEIFVSCLM